MSRESINSYVHALSNHIPTSHLTSPVSASSESRALSIGDIPFFGLHQGPNNNVTSHAFTLTQMATHLQTLSEGLSNDDVGRNIVEEIANRVDVNLQVVKNKEVEHLKFLPSLSWSVKQQPDITVFMEGNGVLRKIVYWVEVRSSPMIFSLRKATLGATDVLRLLHSIDENCTLFTAFAIPNCTEPHAIVMWSSFKFETTNTIYENLIKEYRKWRQSCVCKWNFYLNSYHHIVYLH